MNEKKYIPNFLIIICVFSLLIRVVIIFYLKTYANDYSHTDIGQIPYNLLNGLGYTYNGRPSAYFGPGYTYLWTAMMFVFGIFGGQLALQLLQAIGLSVLPIVWYRLSLSLFDKHIIAFVSSVWLSLYPELLLLSSTMFSESIMMFLWIFTFVMIIWWRESPTHLKGILLGLTIAILILTKGRLLLFIAVPLLYFFILDWKDRKKSALQQYMVPLICVILLMSIWIVRNMIELNKFYTTESAFGEMFWKGHNIDATGTGKYILGSSNISKIKIDSEEFPIGENAQRNFRKSPELQLALKNAQSEAEIDHAYQQEAYLFIINNLDKELELSIKKIFYAWWRDPTNLFTYHPLYIVPWCITMIFFIIGLVKSFSQPKHYLLFYLIFFISTLLQVIFCVVPRYRLPVYPFVFGLGALGFVQTFELMITRNNNLQKKYHAFISRLIQ